MCVCVYLFIYIYIYLYDDIYTYTYTYTYTQRRGLLSRRAVPGRSGPEFFQNKYSHEQNNIRFSVRNIHIYRRYVCYLRGV